MATWKKLLQDGDVESTLEGLSNVSGAAGDKSIILDASDGNSLKTMAVPPEYITMSIGWRAPISDSNGGYRQYFPFETISGDYYWGRYWEGDISTNGTVPSSINVGGARDSSSGGGGYRPNHAMGFTVPINCTALVYNTQNNKNPDYNAGSLTGNNISLTIYHGTPTTGLGNTTTQYDELFTYEFDHPVSNGTVVSGLQFINGASGVALSAGDSLIPSIMSNAPSGSGSRSCFGSLTLLMKMF